MKTVGQILKEQRTKKKLSLEEVEQETKIRTKYLQALEEDKFELIPGETVVAKGFIKNYAEFLDLSPEKLVAVFRRDFGKEEKDEIIPRGVYQPLNRLRFSWTPKTTVIIGFLTLSVFFLIFLVYQFFLFLGPPRLKLTTPKEDQTFSQAIIEVKGRSDPDAVVYVNDQLINLDKTGNFSLKVNLSPGENTIKIEAISRRERRSVIERKVFYQFP